MKLNTITTITIIFLSTIASAQGADSPSTCSLQELGCTSTDGTSAYSPACTAYCPTGTAVCIPGNIYLTSGGPPGTPGCLLTACNDCHCNP